jgi:septal ring factor EnvC (AmiA/AmiB activator)
MNFKVNLVCVDEGETKVNAVIDVTDIDSSTAFQMMKSLRETPEQIQTVIKAAYECIGAEQKRQFDARLQLERDQFEYRKARDEKDDFYKKQAEEYAADRDKLREENRQLKDKLWMMENGFETNKK